MNPNLMLQVAVVVSFCVVGFAYLVSIYFLCDALLELFEKYVAPRAKALFHRRSS